MSLFAALGLEEDPIFGAHMRQMRQMNNMMNSLFSFNDPFQAIMGPQQMMNRQLMPMFSNNMPNRLLNNMEIQPSGVGYSSSSVFSMTTGPDGKPQIYQATSSTKQGPGGLRETRKTLQDSRSGTKKMSIGHHIGERAHVIEKSQDLHTGQMEENEELINLDEEEKEVFNREFTKKARELTGRRHGPEIQAIMPASSQNENGTDTTTKNAEQKKHSTSGAYVVSPNRRLNSTITSSLATARRGIRTPASSPLALPSSVSRSPNHTVSTSVHPHPYNPASRKHKAIKGSSYTTNNRHY